MANLISRLNLPEAVGLSLSVISPTVTAAFNITLVVQAAGPAAPLAFRDRHVAMALVALSFIAVHASRRACRFGLRLHHAHLRQPHGLRRRLDACC